MSSAPRHLPTFTGNARPYAGGDPYADYRGAEADFGFTHLPDLADRRLGASVVAANDEFFADRENLLVPGPARFDPTAYGPKGKVMDGWETRRRRGASATAPHPADDDHDWALVRLGVPGTVHGVVVDTAHFRGNHPQAVALEGTDLPGTPGVADLLADDVPWTQLVPRTPVGGHAAHGFPLDGRQRFTHLRLKQYPDGGIARLRVHGEPLPDPAWLAALDTFDLVALENGGMVEEASDRFFSDPLSTVLPGRSRAMGEGWETRRRRDDGHDWVRYRLTGRARIRAVEIDTGHYKGNAAGWADLSVLDTATDATWRQIVPRVRLEPDAVHRIVPQDAAVGTHVRLDIHPDGGIARLRVHGSLTQG
ncbi:allantoicase [Streptomyces sp. NPDC049585]|uniref:allantoicase n=1 Tax=Streptomyces sp. NPDC049585 TaxID=3155154 RepID=UPI00342D139E